MKNHSQERATNLKATVVVYEAQFPELVHEGVNPRARRAYHLSQCFLTDLWNFGSFAYAVFAEASKQQENAGQSLLAGIEKLINQIFPVADVLRQQVLHEQA